MTRPATIASTGDLGAALGALEAAAELELKIGGWTAADLPPPYAEHLRRTLAPRMAARLNVQDSDGTLIVSFAPGLTAGSPAAYADEAAEHQRKASLHIVLPEGGRSTIPEDVRKGVLAWVAEEKIGTLHVTGPREADEPGIQQAVRDALVWIFEDEVGTGAPEVATPLVSTPPAVQPSPQSVPPGSGATLPRAACLPDAELVRIAVEFAAQPSPTHIAINPEHVDAAIAAGLDVQWLPPGPPPPDVRLMVGISQLEPSPPIREDIAPRRPGPYGVGQTFYAVAAFNRKRAGASAVIASVDVACSTCIRLCFDGVRSKPGGLVRAGVAHATPADGPDVPLCEVPADDRGAVSIGLPGDNVSLDPIVIDDKPDHDYLSAGDTPYADGDRCYTGCFLCGRPRREHRKV